MHTEVSWHVELAIKPGRLEDLRSLSDEMLAAARSEPGTLAYERFITADADRLVLYERYTDSAAAVSHLRAFGERFAARWGALIERKRFTVCGPASPELRAILDQFHPTYLAPFGGFSRGRAEIGAPT
jgi:quinol monooxygenase YgiN